jgi:8-oxo-dGTP diphosphatase
MEWDDHCAFNGAKLALICGDHIVTYKRDRNPGIPFPGLWDLPGGGREGMESPVECVLRELSEEFSLSLSPAQITWVKKYPSSIAAGTSSFFFAGSVNRAEIDRVQFGAEGERWKLMPLNEFLARNDAIPHLKIRLTEYLKDVGVLRDQKLLLASPPIRVSALFRGRLQSDLIEFRPTHVISLLDPSLQPEQIPKFPFNLRVLQLQFFDGDNPTELPPDETTVAQIIGFLSEWVEGLHRNDNPRLLVHCHMGASRSTAVALIALAMVYGPGLEREAFAHGLSILNKPWPNLNLISLADRRLALEGALLGQLLTYRAQYPRRHEAYGRLNRLRRG